MNFVERHEGFHEELGLGEALVVCRLVDDVAQQPVEIHVDFVPAHGIRDLRLEHLDVRCLRVVAFGAASDLALQHHEFIVEAAKLGAFVYVAATDLPRDFFRAVFGHVGIQGRHELLAEQNARGADRRLWAAVAAVVAAPIARAGRVGSGLTAKAAAGVVECHGRYLLQRSRNWYRWLKRTMR